MILGVGAGTFAVLVAIGVAVLIAIIAIYLAPDVSLFILLGCVALPLIVYGCILSAPRAKAEEVIPYSPYREAYFSTSADIIDKFLPVRIVIFVVLALSMFAGIAMHIMGILSEPPYAVPRMRCLREQLEEAHPTWYR